MKIRNPKHEIPGPDLAQKVTLPGLLTCASISSLYAPKESRHGGPIQYPMTEFRMTKRVKSWPFVLKVGALEF
jgi:hypothetical protein